MHDPRNVNRLIVPPAIVMLVLAGMQAVLVIGSFFLDQTSAWMELEEIMREEDPDFELPEALVQGAGLASNLISLAMIALVVAGAVSMLRMKNWGLALAGSIAMVVPCLGPCCPFGIPVGVWAIVMLSRTDVRQAMGSMPAQTPDAFRVAPPPSDAGSTSQPEPPRKEDDGGWGSES